MKLTPLDKVTALQTPTGLTWRQPRSPQILYYLTLALQWEARWVRMRGWPSGSGSTE